MDIYGKRKMMDVLRGVIGSGFDGTQEDLMGLLVKKGFSVTQSTISRALKKIGAAKVSTKNGGSRYELKAQQNAFIYGGSLAALVISIKKNESLIVMRTTPGAAMFVAGQIDHKVQKSVLGTIAGDDTIFISPKSCKKIGQALKDIEAAIAVS